MFLIVLIVSLVLNVVLVSYIAKLAFALDREIESSDMEGYYDD